MANANATRRVLAPETFVLYVIEPGADAESPEPVEVREFAFCRDAIHEARRASKRFPVKAEVWLGRSVMVWSSDQQDVTHFGGPVAPGRWWAHVGGDWQLTFTLRL